MEQKIRDYEKFIAREAKRDYGVAERKRLLEMHQLMLNNFQHERLIHLKVTLFFAFLAVEFILITMWSVIQFGLMAELSPLYFVTLILVILTVFYVKHYYFLENHIQKLYKYTVKIGAK
jgi:hypothetical protein